MSCLETLEVCCPPCLANSSQEGCPQGKKQIDVHRGKLKPEAVVSPSGAQPFWLGCLASRMVDKGQCAQVPHSKCVGQTPT